MSRSFILLLMAKPKNQPKYGARPMRRAVQKYLADPLSEDILRGRFKDVHWVRVILRDGGVELREEKAVELAKV